MPGVSEIKLGFLVVRATIGVLLLLVLVTVVLALLGIEPFKTLYGVQGAFNDPRPLITWANSAEAALLGWLDARPLIVLALLPGLLFFAWALPHD